MSVRSAVVIGLVAFLVWSESAGAVVLCARPKRDGTFSTSLKVREACKPTETLFTAGALGLGLPGIACNWSGTKWLSHGWDGACAFQTGVRVTCGAGGVVTAIAFESGSCGEMRN
jgi:hypothetical protein